MLLCCKCNKTYEFIPLKGDLSLPLIECPHCGFRHTVDFKPVKDQSKLVAIPQLRLTTGPPVYSVARYFTGDSSEGGTRTPLGDDEASVTNYDPSSPFILIIQGDMVKGPWTAQYTLRWRNETTNPGGAFTALASTGQMKWSSSTGLINGNVIATQWCTTVPGGSTWGADGYQVEGAATTSSIVWVDEEYNECGWAIDPADSLASNTYTFEFYDQTNTAAVATVVPTITMKAAVATNTVRMIIANI